MTDIEASLRFIGLMKRAGALAIGAEFMSDAARGGRARLLLLASDAGKNAAGGAKNAQDEGRCPLITLPCTKAELGAALGQRECSALAVTDTGFALALCQKLGQQGPGEELLLRRQREKGGRQKKGGKTKGTVNRGNKL